MFRQAKVLGGNSLKEERVKQKLMTSNSRDRKRETEKERERHRETDRETERVFQKAEAESAYVIGQGLKL